MQSELLSEVSQGVRSRGTLGYSRPLLASWRHALLCFALLLASGCGEQEKDGDERRVMTRELDGATMVLINGGSFRQGALPGDKVAIDDELPAKQVRVEPFWVDETEVTIGQFRRFVDATGYVTEIERAGGGSAFPESSFRGWLEGQTWKSTPPGFKGDQAELDRLPVVFVTWEDSRAYCAWVGARLPTESEFEYLLRQGTKSLYPWGDEPTPPEGYGNYVGIEMAEQIRDEEPYGLPGYRDRHVRRAPVGSYLADSNGLFDISGNVAEWCEDEFVYYNQQPTNEPGVTRIIRGGSFYSHPGRLRCSWRTTAGPTGGREWWGFRCARSAKGK